MPTTDALSTATELAPGWHLLGIAGAVLFYSRFCVQWIVSERRGESTIPESFWYLSSAGTLALLGYAIVTLSPLGALGQCFNIVVYTRNIVFIWRKQGALKPATGFLLHGAAAMVALVAIGFCALIWLREIESTRGGDQALAQQTWFWLGVGVVGQALFAGRFLLQWVATERRGESVVPPLFWHLSIVASALQAACFYQRQEWLFMAGMLFTLFIYARNIALLKAPLRKVPVRS